MRKSFQRALALASSVPMLAGALLASAPAANAVIPTCGTGSTVLAEFDLLGGYHTRIATYDVDSTTKNICIQVLYYEQAVVVLKSGVAVTTPKVTQVTGTGRCSIPIIDMTAPIALSLSVGAATSGTPSLCFGKDGVTTTVSVTGASIQSLPDVDVFTPAYTDLNTFGACLDEYLLYVSGLGTYNNYYYCWSSDHQII